MADFPATGDSPYGPKLKTYIDSGDAVVPPHNHDATYYTEAESDARYHTKTAADARFIISTDLRNAVVLTQAAYDALGVKVATTLYVIVG